MPESTYIFERGIPLTSPSDNQNAPLYARLDQAFQTPSAINGNDGQRFTKSTTSWLPFVAIPQPPKIAFEVNYKAFSSPRAVPLPHVASHDFDEVVERLAIKGKKPTRDFDHTPVEARLEQQVGSCGEVFEP